MSKPEPSRPKTKSYENMGVDANTEALKRGKEGIRLEKKEGAARQTPGVNITGFWRLYEIDKLIAGGYYPNCVYLAEHLEVHKRTVERDIERLRDQFRAPIEYDPKRKGYYYSAPFSLPAMKLQEGEAIAIFLGQKLLAQCKGTSLEDSLKKAMLKIRLLLPDEIEVDLERALEAVSFHVDPLRGDEIKVAQTYQVIAEAMGKGRTVQIDYYTASRDDHTRRKIDPYHLRLSEGSWYCIGFCHERKEERIFALDRIKSIRITDETYQIPSSFSVEEYFGDSLTLERGEPQKVVIEFDKTQVPYVRDKVWHSSQSLEDLPDGGLRLSLITGSLGEVKRWVMSLGQHAVLIEPQFLRDEIREELERAQANYSVVDQNE